MCGSRSRLQAREAHQSSEHARLHQRQRAPTRLGLRQAASSLQEAPGLQDQLLRAQGEARQAEKQAHQARAQAAHASALEGDVSRLSSELEAAREKHGEAAASADDGKWDQVWVIRFRSRRDLLDVLVASLTC